MIVVGNPNEVRGYDGFGCATSTAIRPTPVCVWGGFRMGYSDWTRTSDGWDEETSYDGLPETVFETEGACRDAIDALFSAMLEAA